jgi:hypothetical protein
VIPLGKLADLFLRYCPWPDFVDLPQGVTHPTPPALEAAAVEVEQRGVGDLQLVKQWTEMIDVAASERNNRHGSIVLGNAGGC